MNKLQVLLAFELSVFHPGAFGTLPHPMLGAQATSRASLSDMKEVLPPDISEIDFSVRNNINKNMQITCPLCSAHATIFSTTSHMCGAPDMGRTTRGFLDSWGGVFLHNHLTGQQVGEWENDSFTFESSPTNVHQRVLSTKCMGASTLSIFNLQIIIL